VQDRLLAGLVRQLALRRPKSCPEISLRLIDPSSPLRAANRKHGFWAVHERFEGLAAPPYWAYAWAAGLGLARFLPDHPSWVAGRSALDLGRGPARWRSRPRSRARGR
jgi:predicted nicotinamide N-methyase